MYETVYNHSRNRKGLDAPLTLQAVLKNRPEIGRSSSLP